MTRISVAIAALNEGEQLRATIQCILASKTVPDEIVVYDDCGVVPANVRGLGPKVSVHRGRARIGSGPAKHRAAELCSGSLVILMDGHCRPAYDWLCHIADEHRRHPWAALCPVCVGIGSEDYRANAFRGMGGKLVFEDKGFWATRWNEPKSGPLSYPVQTVIGGCYAIPRRLLDRIGGYAPAYFGYGVEEEFIGLRSWLVGGECRVVPRAVVGHWFNRPINRKTADGAKQFGWEQHFNCHVAAMVCFEDGVYKNVFKPRLDRAWADPQMLARLDSAANEIAKARDRIQRNRHFTDAQLNELIGISIPQGV